MPRRARSDTISEFHIQAIERRVNLLRYDLAGASRTLTPFRPHYDSIRELCAALDRTLNILSGRPADYERPHASLMSTGSSEDD